MVADAEWASPTRMSEPRHADTLADAHALDAGADRIDPADDFMTWNDRRQRIGQLGPFQRNAKPLQNHYVHG